MWYNSEGYPRPNPTLKSSLGCEYLDHCRFVHPDNPDWGIVRSSFPPGPIDWNGKSTPSTPPSDSDFIPMQRRRDKTPTRPRGRSRSRDRDGSNFPGRPYSFQNSRRPSHPPSSAGSPRSPILSGIERNRDSGWSGYRNQPQSSHHHSVERDERRQHSSDLRLPPKDGSGSGSDRSHLLPSRPPVSPAELRTENRQHWPPPPPSLPPTPLPLQPPAPVNNTDKNMLPKLPEFKEMSYKEKTKLWQDRIKLLADACNAHVEYQKLEDEQGHWKTMLNNRAIREISNDAQIILDNSVEDNQQKIDATRKRLNELVESLVVSSFWPVINQQYNGWESAFEEVKRLTENVVAKMDEQDRTIKSFVDTKQDDLNDTRGTKRRRISTEGGVGENAVSPDLIPKSQVVPKDIEPQLQNQIELLDGHIGDIENQLVQQESEITQLLEEKIDEKTEAIIGLNSELKQATEERLNDLDKNYLSLDDDVKELASYVTHLFNDMKSVNDEMVLLRRERDEMKERIVGLENQRRKDEDEIANMRKQLQDAIDETRALNALYRQSIKGPKSLPEPDTATPEAIATFLQPQIVKSVREDILPVVIELRKHVEDILSTRNNELYSKVWPKVDYVAELGRALQIQLNGRSTNSSIAK